MAVTADQPISAGNIKALFGKLAEITTGGGFLDNYLYILLGSAISYNGFTTKGDIADSSWDMSVTVQNAGTYQVDISNLSGNSASIRMLTTGKFDTNVMYTEASFRITVSAGDVIQIKKTGAENSPNISIVRLC